MENPGKMIPLVMGLSLLVVSLLYILIAVVATGVLPLVEIEGKNLAATAKVIFSPWGLCRFYCWRRYDLTSYIA